MTECDKTPLIETRGLKKYFNTPSGILHAVDDVNITIKKGDTLGVVGESGCGKSTMGRSILRLLEPTSGSVLYNGEDILKYDKRRMLNMRSKMQIIFQDPYSSLNPRMNVADIIADPMKVSAGNSGRMDSRDIYKRVSELMDIVGLARRFINSYPHELDGGRRQRIGIARALALDPEFIVCDEPVSALDVSIQAQILNLLMDLQDEMGLTYMFVTHDLSVVKHISDEIAVMYLGRCVERAPVDELFANPLHPYTKALLAALPKPSLKSRGMLNNVIRGEVSNPIDPKPGCRFAPRCDCVRRECTQEDIQLTEHSPGHFAACIAIR